MKWMPIETAPTDGTRVLVYFHSMANWNHVEIAWFGVDPNDGDDDPCWLFGDGDDFSTGYYYTPITPTHWMPLPEAPNTEA